MGRFFIIWAIRGECVPKLNLVVGKTQFFVAIGLFPCWLSLRDLWTISVCCISFHRAPYNFKASWLSLSSILYQSFLKLMSIELVVPSYHLILCHLLVALPSIFPRIRIFPMSQLFTSSGQNIGTSAIASVLPMNIQG